MHEPVRTLSISSGNNRKPYSVPSAMRILQARAEQVQPPLLALRPHTLKAGLPSDTAGQQSQPDDEQRERAPQP